MALPAPNDPVSICNLSLTQLAQAPVADIDEPTTDTEALCKIHYPQQRRAVLRSHPVNFAIKRAVLASNATAPVFGFSQAYDLPTDFIRFLTRHDDNGVPIPGEFIEGVDYQLEDGQFLTNAGGTTGGVLNMRYIFDQERILSWDPLFINVLVIELALVLAPQFKSNTRTVDKLERKLREVKAEAKAIDGQERPPRRVQHSKWLAARRNRGSQVADRFTRFD